VTRIAFFGRVADCHVDALVRHATRYDKRPDAEIAQNVPLQVDKEECGLAAREWNVAAIKFRH
jgi:hypothetical protein